MKLLNITAILISTALLSACGGGGGSTPVTTIKVTNTDGGKTDITGSWLTSNCFPGLVGVKPDYKFIETFSGTNTYGLVAKGYTTTDGTCSGTQTEEGRITGTFTIGSDLMANGWINGTTTLVAAPTAQDGSTLPATPSGTKLVITLATKTGSFASLTSPRTYMRVVDATMPANVAIYDLYNDGVNGPVADIAIKATRQ